MKEGRIKEEGGAKRHCRKSSVSVTRGGRSATGMASEVDAGAFHHSDMRE